AMPLAVGRVTFLSVSVSRVFGPSLTSSQRTTASSPLGIPWRGPIFHSYSKTNGGSHWRIRPVMWTSPGPPLKSIDPPGRPSTEARIMYHDESCLGSVRACQTASGGCGRTRRNTSVASAPSYETLPTGDSSCLDIVQAPALAFPDLLVW